MAAVNTNFQKTICVAALFFWTDLTNASFWHSNLKRTTFKRATLTGVNFSDANLYGMKFIETRITDKQLENALSIQEAVLVNGTRTHDKNLIDNSENRCNISQTNDWMLESGSVNVTISNEYKGHCMLTLQSFSTGAVIYQRINLSNKWDSNFWSYSKAVLSAKMSDGVFIELKGINSNNEILARQSLSKPYDNSFMIKYAFYIGSFETSNSMTLSENMQELEILVIFDSHKNSSNAMSYWCDNMKLSIIYGTDSELFRGKQNIADFLWIFELAIVTLIRCR